MLNKGKQVVDPQNPNSSLEVARENRVQTVEGVDSFPLSCDNHPTHSAKVHPLPPSSGTAYPHRAPPRPLALPLALGDWPPSRGGARGTHRRSVGRRGGGRYGPADADIVKESERHRVRSANSFQGGEHTMIGIANDGC